MKIRILTPIAGANWHARPGDVIDLPEGESAERFFAAGIAEPVQIETAAVSAPETAAIMPPAKVRKGK